jgi:eukaryotic-like serine/threonine-protein kinase
MFRSWRGVTLVATLLGSAAIAAQLAAVVPARAATPAVTVAARSSIPPVTGDVFVVYHGGTYGSARIHGTIAGAAAGEVVTLYAQRFPYTAGAKPVSSVTLSATGPTTAYSFTVAPTLATRYQVKLFASKTATTPLATSPRQNLYVVTNGRVTGLNTCGRPVCHETLHIYTILPSSALRVQMGQPWYPYFGINLSATGTPSPPRWLYLHAGHASVSAARRISAGEFENTLTLSFTIGHDGYYWGWTACTKDVVSRDGLGLPGSHGCGAHRVFRTVAYLG